MKGNNKYEIYFNLYVRKLRKIICVENFVFKDCINICVYVCLYRCMYVYMYLCVWICSSRILRTQKSHRVINKDGIYDYIIDLYTNNILKSHTIKVNFKKFKKLLNAYKLDNLAEMDRGNPTVEKDAA